MPKTKETLDLEKALEERSRKKREYGCTEVTIGFHAKGHGDEIVDYLSMDSNSIFQCYELKVTLSDLKSDAKKSWYGDYNYLVVSESLYARNPAWGNYIPPYVGILSGTSLKVRRQAKKKTITEETRNMLKDSLIRSVFWKMEQYKDAGDLSVIQDLEKQLSDLQQQFTAYKKEQDDILWTYKDFEFYYQKNHRNSSTIASLAKEERRQYALRNEGRMQYENGCCPVCGKQALFDENGHQVFTRFCPYCGTDLQPLE